MSPRRTTRTINFRIDLEAHDLIAQATEARGKSMTAFMIEASVHTAQEEFDHCIMSVLAEAFEAVNDRTR